MWMPAAQSVGGRVDGVDVQVSELLATPTGPLESWSTGAPWVDEMTGGLRRGDLWVITGHPGQGKTAVLLEIASNLTQQGASTVLTTREPRAVLRDRLAATMELIQEMPVPLSSGRPVDALQCADMWVAVDGSPINASRRGDDTFFDVSLVDNPGQWGADLAQELHLETRRGATVVAAVPIHDVVRDAHSGDLSASWGALANIVVEVRTIGLTTDQTGLAEIALLKNNRGPLASAWHHNQIYRGRLIRGPVHSKPRF